MRGAPPVQVAVGPDAIWRLVNQGLHALAGASVAAWTMLHLDVGDAVTLSMAVLAAAVMAGWLGGRWAWLHLREALAWDGQTWVWRGEPAEVAVMLDLDRWVLLRVSTTNDRTWVPLTLRGRGEASALLRAALQAHAGRSHRGSD